MKNIFGAIILLMLLACNSEKPSTNTTATYKKDIDSLTLTQTQISGVNIKFAQFTPRIIKPLIYANGAIKLLPESKAEVSSHISGKVEQIFVREGMFVKKDQVLLSMSSFDALELQNEYVSAKNEAEFQKVEYERQAALKKRSMGVLADYQATRSKYQSAIIKEKTLKQKLAIVGIDINGFLDLTNPVIQKTLNIKAPFDGYVNKLNVHTGSLVETETILAEIIDPNQLRAEVYVYEKDVDLVEEGLPVKLNFIQKGIAPIDGKVMFISRALDATNKTITLYVSFTKPKNTDIHADMNLKAVITGVASNTPMQALPATSIYDDGEHQYIFATTNITSELVAMKKFRIETIKEDDGYVVIKSIQKLPKDCWVADNNVLAIEAERKKNE